MNIRPVTRNLAAVIILLILHVAAGSVWGAGMEVPVNPDTGRETTRHHQQLKNRVLDRGGMPVIAGLRHADPPAVSSDRAEVKTMTLSVYSPNDPEVQMNQAIQQLSHYGGF